MSALADTSLTNSQVVRLADRRRPPRRLARFIKTLGLWHGRVEQRRALARLTQRELADFGASSADVFRELKTPFWRAQPPC